MTERNRERGGYISRPRSSFWWNTSQSPKPTPTYVAEPNCDGGVEWMRDFVRPRFEEFSAKGGVIVNPMWKTKDLHAYYSVGPKFKKVVGTTTYWGELLDGPWGVVPSAQSLSGRSSPSYESLIAEVRTRALANVKPPEYTGLVTAGEFRETLRYLRNPLGQGLRLAEKLERDTRKIKRRNPRIGLSYKQHIDEFKRTGKKIFRDPAVAELEGLYLEFRYAVRPLVYDTTQLLLAIQKPQTNPKRETFRAASTAQHRDSWTTSEGFNGITYDVDWRYDREVTVRAGTMYEHLMEYNSAHHFGLDMTEIPGAIWELTSLSFVVDWFVNVQQFVDALRPAYGMKRLAEWTTVRIDETLTASKTNWRFSDWTTAQQGSGLDTWTHSFVSRVPDIGAPSLVVKATALDTFSDVGKVLDLLSLTHQKLRSASDLRARG